MKLTNLLPILAVAISPTVALQATTTVSALHTSKLLELRTNVEFSVTMMAKKAHAAVAHLLGRSRGRLVALQGLHSLRHRLTQHS